MKNRNICANQSQELLRTGFKTYSTQSILPYSNFDGVVKSPIYCACPPQAGCSIFSDTRHTTCMASFLKKYLIYELEITKCSNVFMNEHYLAIYSCTATASAFPAACCGVSERIKK